MGAAFYNFCPEVDLNAATEANEQALDAPRGACQASQGPAFCSGIDSFEWYVASFSWSTMVITGTGGTDFYPSSKSTPETMLVTFLVLIGAILWTQVLASFCDVATNADPQALHFRQTLDDMNAFLSAHCLSPAMCVRVREYLYAQRDCQMRLETAKAVKALSPSLQVEVLMEVQRDFFQRVPFLREAEAPFCVQITLAMDSGVFAPGELASLLHLYVIERGLALDHGRILSTGKTWGENEVILTEGLLSFAREERARAMTYLEYRGISRDALQAVVNQFPATRTQLRRRAVFIATARKMVQLAKAERKAVDEGSSSDGSGSRVTFGAFSTSRSTKSSSTSRSIFDAMISAARSDAGLQEARARAVESLKSNAGFNGSKNTTGLPLEKQFLALDRKVDLQFQLLDSKVNRCMVLMEASLRGMGQPIPPEDSLEAAQGDEWRRVGFITSSPLPDTDREIRQAHRGRFSALAPRVKDAGRAGLPPLPAP